MGGKGRGLGFMHMTLQESGVSTKFPGVRVRVPWTLAISTSVFDEFMENSQLYEFALNSQVIACRGGKYDCWFLREPTTK